MCVCVCVRAYVRAYVRVCVRASIFNFHVKFIRLLLQSENAITKLFLWNSLTNKDKLFSQMALL